METPYLRYLNNKERFPRSLVHGPIRRYFRRFLDAADDGTRLLDAGCGNGIESGPLADRLEVHGIDYQPEYVAYCCELYPNADYRIGNLEQLEYPDDHFGLIISNQVIEHLERPTVVLDELYRVLAPGGTLVVATPNYGNVLWPIVENTYHRWFVREFDAEENHVTKYDTGMLHEHLSRFEAVEAGTVCLTTILVGNARKPLATDGAGVRESGKLASAPSSV